MKYKFLKELENLLVFHDQTWLNALKTAEPSVWSPNLIGPAIQKRFPDCPVGTSNYRDGATIAWLAMELEEKNDQT